MPFLATSISGFTPGSTSSIPDRVTAFLIVAFAQGKFYLLFAFLFGYSLTLLLLAALIGLPGGLFAAWLSFGPGPTTGQGDLLAVAICFGTAPALTAGYIAVPALRTTTPALRAVQPAGRMSLTGYLGESILMAAIFCGWGLGLFGRLGAFHAALIALAVWLALDLFAGLWLRRFRYGPFEWFLRAWSYRRLPAMRIRNSDRRHRRGRRHQSGPW